MLYRQTRLPSLIIAVFAIASMSFAQPCLVDYTFTANPPPVGGTYASGQTVQFCFTVNAWDPVDANNNWLHSVVPSFGPGWDMSTLVPGAPPLECGGMGGTWNWYNSCTGTSPFSLGTVGPGFFFDLDNDGDPGNNLGDECAGPWGSFCFTISAASGVNCVDGNDLGVGVNGFGDSETGSWDQVGCLGDMVAPLAAIAQCCPTTNAGFDGFANVCISDAPFDLFSYLGNNPDAGGTWTDPFGNPSNPVIDPSIATSGDYIYTAPSNPGCIGDQAIVIVVINFPANAGADAVATVCDQGQPDDLFPYLVGADPGGSWTDPGGGFSNGFFDPAFNTPGDYTYTAFGAGTCPSDQSIVTVNVIASPNAGTDGVLALCTTSAITDLFSQLAGGAQPGGTWTDPGGLPHGPSVDPSIDTPGDYTYTVLGTAPCADDFSILTVNINAPPPSGVAGAATLCSNDPTLDLWTAFNGQLPAGGTWTDGNGNASTGQFDPSINSAGTYNYTLAGIQPCPDGLSTVDVVVNIAPDPGANGLVTLCGSGGPETLFTSLLGTPDVNGTWTDPANAPVSGTIDPAIDAPGLYTYTVPANGLCAGGSATVDVTIIAPANAGVDASLALCNNDASQNLFSALGGTPAAGGAWLAPGGTASTGTIDPASAVVGDYTYTVQGTAPCPDVSATVTVTIDQLPYPGTDNSISVCADAATQQLFTLLGGADGGGAWTAPDGSASDGLFDPDSSLTGGFTYTLIGPGACATDTVTAVITATSWPLPSPTFTQDTTRGCAPLDISFLLQDPAVTQASWIFGDGSSGSGAPSTMHTFEEAGWYDVGITVTDANGCTFTITDTNSVQVFPLPIAHFVADPDPNVTLSTIITFTPSVTEYPVYEWEIDGHPAGSDVPMVHHFPELESGVYNVCLHVVDSVACEMDYCTPIEVRQELSLNVPNAFTPDGNGINEGFVPVVLGADEKSYELDIFDRWGGLVFESHKIGEAWDGSLGNNGTKLPEGVFAWRLRLRESISAERQDIYGHVTLLK